MAKGMVEEELRTGGNEKSIGKVRLNKSISESERERIIQGAKDSMNSKKSEVEFIRAGLEDRMNNLGTTIPEGSGPAIITAGLTLKTLVGLEDLNTYMKFLIPIIIILLIYIIYVLNKMSLTGDWISHKQKQHLIISHNRFTDSCKVKFGIDGKQASGYVKNNKLYIFLDESKNNKPVHLKLKKNYTKIN